MTRGSWWIKRAQLGKLDQETIPLAVIMSWLPRFACRWRRQIGLGVSLFVCLLSPVVGLGQSLGTPAREALLLDADTGAVLLEKNADAPTPPSSMAKLMTVYMVFERLKAGALSLDDRFAVSEKAWRTGGSKTFVGVAERVRVEDLLRGVIVQSGNDACIVLAEGLAGSEEAFADRMTARGRELGLRDSIFMSATGLPAPGQHMTARDLALLAKRLIADFPEYYRYFAETEFVFNNVKQGNRNPLLYGFNGGDGLKTGHTEEAGFGLTGSAKRGERRLILVLNGLDSERQRAFEAERLLETAFREYDNYRLLAAGAVAAEAEVWMGAEPRVPLVAAEAVVITLPKRHKSGLKASVTYEGPLPAPIVKGSPLAKLVIHAPEMGTREVPLYAGADVERRGWFGRILAAIGHYLSG
jgi:D-alanyl-D-alanine carboxypeptidase (penicillin-binding protein 5/6)